MEEKNIRQEEKIILSSDDNSAENRENANLKAEKNKAESQSNKAESQSKKAGIQSKNAAGKAAENTLDINSQTKTDMAASGTITADKPKIASSGQRFTAKLGGKKVSSTRLLSVVKSQIRSGKNKLQQSVVMQQMIIESKWIETIEDYIHSLENIVKNPRSFIKEQRDLVVAEKARNADRTSLRHLSSHSEYVRTIKDDGTIEPKKVLVKFMQEDIAIYENCVAYTLIHHLKVFIEERYQSIKELIRYYEITDLNMLSEFAFGKANIKYSLNLKISQRLSEKETSEELLVRLENIRKRVQIMDNSKFAKEMQGTKPIKPPLQRTNMLTKNIDYRNVYNLWVFISSFGEVGYKVHTFTQKTPFDAEYTEDLTKLVADSVKVMIKNNTLRGDQFENIRIVAKRPRRFSIIKKVEPKVELLPPTSILPKATGDLSQFYYDKIRYYFGKEADKARKTSKIESQSSIEKGGKINSEDSAAKDVSSQKNGTSSEVIPTTFAGFAKKLSRISRLVLQEVVESDAKKKAKDILGVGKTQSEKTGIRLHASREQKKSYAILIKQKQDELASLKRTEQNLEKKIKKEEELFRQRVLQEEKIKERKELKKQKELEKRKKQQERERERKAKELAAERERKAMQQAAERERKARELQAERERKAKEQQEERERREKDLQALRDRKQKELQAAREQKQKELQATRDRKQTEEAALAAEKEKREKRIKEIKERNEKALAAERAKKAQTENKKTDKQEE
jgi:hypothetical protein